jgi:hypothetical protein
MANVEIDENELASLRRYAQVADKMAKHPEARKLVQQAALLADPDSVGPEPRIRAEVADAMSAIRDELKADREARAKEGAEQAERERTQSLERRWAAGRAKARERGFTDEGMSALEDWMIKHEVADHEIAIPAFERENPPPEPVMTGSQGWNFFDTQSKEDVSLKPLLEGNEDAFLGPAIQTALRDVRTRR